MRGIGCFQCFRCPGKPIIPTADDTIAMKFVEQVTNSFNDDDDKVDANVEKLQRCGSKVISVIGASATSNHPLSFLSLAEAADGLRKVNGRALTAMSNCKREISKNPDLQRLVNDFRRKHAQVLNSFAGVKQCIRKARQGEALIHAAIARFGDGDYDAALENLREFEVIGETLTESFLHAFVVALEQQRAMLEDLRDRSGKLDKKLNRVKAWKKLYNLVYVATFIGALICSVVLAAVTAPPAGIAAPAAVTTAMAPLGGWLNNVWKKYEGKIMYENEMVDGLENMSLVVVDEMDGIRLVVKNLEDKLGAIRTKVKVAEEGCGVWKALVKDIKRNGDEFTASLAMLENEVDRFQRDLRWISETTRGNPHRFFLNSGVVYSRSSWSWSRSKKMRNPRLGASELFRF